MSVWSRRGLPVFGRGDPWFYGVMRLLLALVLVPLFRYQASGDDATPRRGGVILAVTHKSWFDPLFAGMAFRRPLRFMAKSELFRNRAFAMLITQLGAVSIKRKSADIEALKTALGLIASGEMFLMFPEGHRFHDDVVHEFQPGVAMLAVRSGAPVLPVAIRGSARLVPFSSRVRVVVGDPVDLSGLEGRRSEVYAQAAGRIRQAVTELYERT
jgi:1-acyl-sn-glycerol-3-phosphate acyltransferase